jgi:hypothetical protein
MSEQPGFKLGQLDNERCFQEMDSVKPLSDSLGYLSDKLLKYAEEYPGLTRAVSDAAIGIKAMAAAAAVFGAIKWMSGLVVASQGSNLKFSRKVLLATMPYLFM